MSPPAKIQVRIYTPEDRCVSVTCRMDVPVEEFVGETVAKLGLDTSREYVLEVSLEGEGGEPVWYPLEPEDRLLDALRGLQKPPRIVADPTTTNHNHD